MQPQMAQLLEDWLGPYVVFVQSKHGQPVVDIAGTLRGIKVLMNELKTDNGGNARIELLVSLMIPQETQSLGKASAKANSSGIAMIAPKLLSRGKFLPAQTHGW